MKTSFRRTAWDVLVFLAIGLGPFIWPQPVAGQKITRENGVQVIHNPKDPVIRKGVPSTPVFKEDLVIGAESGDEKYVFSNLQSMSVDDEGHIYVLDGTEDTVRVFDGNGLHLRTFGKKGQGPGEWDDPFRLSMTPSGELVILDSGNSKISYFSKTGRCLRETPFGKHRILRALVDEEGRIYGDQVVPKDSGIAFALARFDSKMNFQAPIAETEPRKIVPGESPMLLDRLAFKLLGGSRLAWANPKEYVITIVHPEKGILRKIVKPFDRRKVTDQDKKDEIQSGYGNEPPVNTIFTFPEYYSPIYNLIADEKGSLYVQTNAKDAAGEIIHDVFDPEGVFIARFALPASELLFAARAGKLYRMILENEAGTPQIKRCSLEWK